MSLLSWSQSITPVTSAAYCPNTNTNFVVTITGSATSVAIAGFPVPGVTGCVPVTLTTGAAVSTSGGNTLVGFTGRFLDLNAPQGIRVTYNDAGGVARTFYVHYDRIQSFSNQDVASKPVLNISSVAIPRCQTQSFNVNFTNVVYINPVISPQVTYGSVTTYKYLLPSGWKLDGVVSNGSSALPGGSNVTITSDLTTGNGQFVRVFASNPCGTGLSDGPPAQISISRGPVLAMAATGNNTICTGSTPTYSVNGLISGSTVTWSASPAGLLNIASPTALQTVVTRNGSAAGTATLTATVTEPCGSVFPLVQSIIVGSKAPTAINLGPTTNFDVEVYVSAVPGATSYNWYLNGVLETSQHAAGADLLAHCNLYHQVGVEAVGACGVSTRTYRSVRWTCGGGNFIVSPNPASGSVVISSTDLNAAKTTANSSSGIDEIKIYDLKGTLKKQKKFNKSARVTLDVSNLEKGVYFIEIKNGNGSERKELIIQK